LDLEPNNKIALNGKGASLDELERFEEAITYYDKALVLDPNFVYALDNKGIALNDLGKPEEAVTYLDK
jgi:Flp pilus assembly protein TadD